MTATKCRESFEDMRAVFEKTFLAPLTDLVFETYGILKRSGVEPKRRLLHPGPKLRRARRHTPPWRIEVMSLIIGGES